MSNGHVPWAVKHELWANSIRVFLGFMNFFVPNDSTKIQIDKERGPKSVETKYYFTKFNFKYINHILNKNELCKMLWNKVEIYIHKTSLP